MLNTKLIGSYISSLRKEKDMTQVELADNVNVSHQAVSKWERGESLPDIETLIELGKLFRKSVDGLLSGGQTDQGFKNTDSFVRELSANRLGKAADLINNGETKVDGFVSIAPLLKASTIDKITGHLTDQTLTLEHLVELAPFLEQTSLSELIEKVDNEHMSKEQVISIAPFVDRETLKNFVNPDENTMNLEEIISIAPFLGDNLDQLVLQTDLTTLEFDDINALAPFATSEALVDLIEKAIAEPLTLEQNIRVAPFLDDHADRFIQQAAIDRVTWDELKDIAPFIKKDTLATLVNKASLEKVSFRSLIEIAPFLGDQLEPILNEIEVNEITPDILAEIAPFVRKETLARLMETFTK
ncbi:helix-turn-helix transcriptional regulator [Alkalihalobacillus sp. AL-G]|uniref:helix-turn-helix transcriptional regulator n=1 Tax=Alkalihalobacillus sp. AL-G TaxID=2926399 RepID=UPI00272C0B8F|nr:helix-turn-helix transcriptional regulator [Alkalihalobacillus sp. AL-G]WLD92529.1 helix-turn-helix domain-containing protein [Alkalihalobacillus sp. AL-G]